MSSVRSPAVAGFFYPEHSGELAATVDELLATAEKPAETERAPKAIITPHAGYVYSGAIAAAAYARVKARSAGLRRVILIGPCHRVALQGMAVPTAETFTTPLGPIPLDRDAILAISGMPQVSALDAAHAEEHALEVQLPFLQRTLGAFTLVPIVVGRTDIDALASVIDRLWGGEETLIVVSSDLSHYLDYASACKIDAQTCRAIVTMDIGAIGPDQACGRLPVQALLSVAKRRGLVATTVDLKNSGDMAGDRSRVVGYGAWVFTVAERCSAPAMDR
ncbi:MAG: AmmeMemoRadiSam system protein B [Rhodospirillales bacterium]|nr:AmmeMemoRadiSam system protein B [Rhodospirillales bacterium]